MSRLKQGEPFRVDIAQVAQAGVVEAIPYLKKQFSITQDQTTKEAVASALVRLGDGDPTYWDYLVQGATAAIDSDEPFPEGFDAKGKLVPRPSQEFTAWAKAHNLTIDSAVGTAMHDYPLNVMFLGTARDPRAIPLLRQALASPNYVIQEMGAEALADMQDKASIPFIIAACRNAPAELASALAKFLMEFDDPQAQSAVKEFAPVSPEGPDKDKH
jgi:HEAT repeat protein